MTRTKRLMCVVAAVLVSSTAIAQAPKVGSAVQPKPQAGYKLTAARFHLRTTNCNGFDHGPIYGPEPCNFPYNCEMFDGACGKGRALPNTIGKH